MRRYYVSIFCLVIGLVLLVGGFTGASTVNRHVYSPQGLSKGLDNQLFRETKKLLPSDGAATDYFGFSVAISGNIAVVGAREYKTANGTRCGSAYIFYRHHGGIDNWGQVANIVPADGRDYDYFGHSVAIYGHTVVIGALWDDDRGSKSGSVYIFYRNQGGSGNWGQVAKLTAPDGRSYDYFGQSLAIYGHTVAVGAHGDDDRGSDSGSVYIFNRNQGGTDNWGYVAKRTASDGRAGDYFGYSLALGKNTLAVGAHGDDDRGSSSGSAYIFYRFWDNHKWKQVAKRTASDAASYDYFGYSVAIDGDTVAVTAPRDDDNGYDSGSAYIFQQNQGGSDNWGEVAKLTASDGESYDYFGRSVSISGDLMVVGADEDDFNGSNSGSAYVFQRNHGGTNNWGEVDKLTAADGSSGDSFGLPVYASGDTVLVGAHRKDDKGWGSGSAYIYTLAKADVAVGKRVSDNNPSKGDDILFTITAANKGPDPIEGVQVSDPLPFGLAYISSVCSRGSYDLATGIWDIGSISSGLSATLKIKVRVTETGLITNTAAKTRQYGSDPAPGNDSACVTLCGNNPPEISITTPQHRAVVSGTIDVKAAASDDTGIKKVSFFIDDNRTKVVTSDPYVYRWDTTLYANGNHKIKVTAADLDGQTAEDRIDVKVNNIIIKLDAARLTERAWLVQQVYGNITFTISSTGSFAVSRYVIERRQSTGAYQTVKEIPISQVFDNTCTHRDQLPDKNAHYTYRVLAVDGSGMVVGRSGEKGI
jgi:uncharacterized repeat protein (TIGR01451 family)